MRQGRRTGTEREIDEIFSPEVVGEAVEKAFEEAPRQDRERGRSSDLREHADKIKTTVLAQTNVAEAEDQYRKALAETAVLWDGRSLLGFLRLLLVTAALGTIPAAAVMFGWARELKGHPKVSVFSGDVMGLAFVVLCALVGAGLLAYLLIAGGRVFRPQALLAAVALVAAASTVLLGTGTHNVVATRSGSGSGSGSDPWGLLAFVAAGTVWWLSFTVPIQRWWLACVRPGDARTRQTDLDALRSAWREEVKEALVSTFRFELTGGEGRYGTSLEVRDVPGLRRTRDTSFHVRTGAESLLVKVGNGMDGGSIALSGPRGVGKTELLEAFCAGEDVASGAPVGLSVVVTAPVAHDRREFMLHLFTELCERARTLGPRPLRKEADRHLERIRYLRTVSSEASLNATVRSLGFSATRGASLAREPLTYPEIVKAFKGFLTLVADQLARTGPGGGRRKLVIGIDELDRIQPASSAREFLNEIKIIFDVPNCLFVLSVSDEALHQADLAPAGRRDVFDSAIDEVIRIEPLDHEGAVRLLKYRVIGLPEPFTALFNCLACGVPRDLLRIARAAMLFSEKEEEGLSETAERLVRREWARLVNGLDTDIPAELNGHGRGEFGQAPSSGWEDIDPAVANRFIFLDTVGRVFSHDDAAIRAACRGDGPKSKSFTALAKAGSLIGTNDRQARSALREVRDAWWLGPTPDIPGRAPDRHED